ncbi:MAG: hypothetical protein HKN70_08735 [Gammaproteobacteria bacterium]|nr:hypothetical protein [Gammaproteobacteria bacterium]
MFKLSDFSSRACRSLTLTRHAALAVIAGVLVYLVGRDQMPVLMPLWLQTQPVLVHLRNFWPDFLTLQLPSFLHAYIILLMGIMVCRTGRLATVAIMGGTVLCLTLEFVQHPSVSSAVATAFVEVPDTGMRNVAINAVLAYVVAGTFDYLDLVAILLATLLLTLQIATSEPDRTRSVERP